MPGLQPRQGYYAAGRPCAAYPYSLPPLHTRARRPCGAPSCFFWGLQPHLHHDRQVYQVVRGGPTQGHLCHVVRDTFVATWVARFGVPECITSDRGPQFTSVVWSALCSRLGISRSLTTAFHPQSNGMVERAHRQLKDALRARAAGHDWPTHLPWVLLGLRTAPKEDSNISSAELCLGAPLTLPGEFIAGLSRRRRSLWTPCRRRRPRPRRARAPTPRLQPPLRPAS